ncbi:class I SAM-dependent methyltransferase [Nostoc sp. MS1]|uniref:class I SAM-dependent methyltransferase n=1 Tax=Nostoc sp. MS1 TaxID=2764711 RepID=UPI0021E10514|nr:class I SAM-dependent methyltransferase [Nostoc sp. MS1]
MGFGSGVGIERLSCLASAGYIAGIDNSKEMVEQATVRNREEIEGGRVDLRLGSVESLPFEDNKFDKVLAVNSMQVWTDAVVGLRSVRRVMKEGGTIALGLLLIQGKQVAD